MSCCQTELTLDQLLADPLTEAVMKADRLNRDDVTAMLRDVADGIAPDQSPRVGSVMGQLVGMLANYYDAVLCGCNQPERQYRLCKAL